MILALDFVKNEIMEAFKKDKFLRVFGFNLNNN
jgi:hypothetical protein